VNIFETMGGFYSNFQTIRTLQSYLQGLPFGKFMIFFISTYILIYVHNTWGVLCIQIKKKMEATNNLENFTNQTHLEPSKVMKKMPCGKVVRPTPNDPAQIGVLIWYT
jgi:hypothetical protein